MSLGVPDERAVEPLADWYSPMFPLAALSFKGEPGY
jgi:hypothetical protein